MLIIIVIETVILDELGYTANYSIHDIIGLVGLVTMSVQVMNL